MYKLKDEFERRFGPSCQEAERLKSELDALTSDTSFDLSLRQLRAKMELIDREIICLTAEARFEKADKKEAEKREIEECIQNLKLERNQKIEGLKERMSSLSGQKNEIANQILREAFISLQREAWSHLEEAADFIDSAWKEIENFHMETGATGAGVGIHNLRIYPNSDQRKLWLKISKWVHVAT